MMGKINFRKLREGWAVQMRVIHALMIRELITRFGRENIGFLWVMAEPLLFAGLVGIIWRMLKGPEEHGISIVTFVATGYIPLTLVRHVISRCVAAFSVNSSLLYHRQIKVVDFIFVRFIIEMIGSMMAYLFIGVILIYFGEAPVPADIGLFLAGWFCHCFFALSVCFIVAPLSEMSEVMEKFIPVTLYVMIPFSGVFTMLSWTTPTVREYLILSPLVSGMEMMRKGIWGDQITAYYEPQIPITCSVICTIIGLTMCRRVRKTLSIQ
ncbi:ABC transporter permease [Sphingobium xenophagum]|uniref:ABC transporter permease n=1 Tax=Sphingobium xenophagum TaxID=121428 RepID=UPI0020CDFDB7|nr:ABC transporter permease [Sphingobium xenophagum]